MNPNKQKHDYMPLISAVVIILILLGVAALLMPFATPCGTMSCPGGSFGTQVELGSMKPEPTCVCLKLDCHYCETYSDPMCEYILQINKTERCEL